MGNEERADVAGSPGAGKRRRRRRRKRSSGSSAATSGGTASGGASANSNPASSGGGSSTKGRAPAASAGAGSASKGRSRKKKRRGSPRKKPPGKGPVHKEISAGGVVYRRSEDGVEVVLASRRTRRGDLAWGLAKGGIEEGESHEEAAIREVQEETGLTAKIEGSLGDTKYFYVWGETRIRKTVHFFLMRHTGGDTDDHDDEMEEIRWFPLERAMKRAAYKGEREMLARAAERLR